MQPVTTILLNDMTALVRAAGLAGYESLAHRLGLDPARELNRAGLHATSLEDPDALIPYMSVIRLLERSSQESRCDDFGLRLSESQNIEILGPLAVLMRHASTLGDALQLAARHVFVHSPAICFGLDSVDGDPASVDLSFEINIPRRPPSAQTIELSLGLILRILRMLVPRGLRPMCARFPHARIAKAADYQRALNCACAFGVERAAIRASAHDLDLPLAGHNRLLLEMAQSYLDQHYGEPERLLSDRVRDLVRRFMGTCPMSQKAVSDDLNIHPRTLQRRLLKEDQTFDAIVDEVRRERLSELLSRSPSPTMTQIALMLGYSEQAALTRSCHRWFGCAPTELRRRYRREAR